MSRFTDGCIMRKQASVNYWWSWYEPKLRNFSNSVMYDNFRKLNTNHGNVFNQQVTISGPNLSIEIDENLTTKREDSRIAEDVFCCVDTAIGIPKFTLSCLGCLSDGFEIVQQNTAIEGHDNYLYGIHHAVVHLPITGILSCNVTDNLGTYVVTQTIGDQGERISHLGPKLDPSCPLYPSTNVWTNWRKAASMILRSIDIPEIIVRISKIPCDLCILQSEW